MPVNQIITPGPLPASVPTGLGRPPWLERKLGTVEVARTVVIEQGSQLLRAADKDVRHASYRARG